MGGRKKKHRHKKRTPAQQTPRAVSPARWLPVLASVLAVASVIFAAGQKYSELRHAIHGLRNASQRRQLEVNEMKDELKRAQEEISHQSEKIDTVMAVLKLRNAREVRGHDSEESVSLPVTELSERNDDRRSFSTGKPAIQDLGELHYQPDIAEDTEEDLHGHSQRDFFQKLARASTRRVKKNSANGPTYVAPAPKRSRSPEDIRKVLVGHNPAIQDCYRRRLKADPDLKGELTIRFFVNAKGHLQSPTIIKSTLNSETLERAIIDKMMQWRDFGEIAESGLTKYRLSYKFGLK